MKIRPGLVRNYFVVSIVLVLLISGCKPPPVLRDKPVTHWLQDPDPCIRKTAEAIVASGRPYPNEIWEQDPNARTGVMRMVERDFWVGDQLYVVKRGFPYVRVGGPEAHPLAAFSMHGNVEEILGIPPRKFKHPGVGGTLHGNVDCNIGKSPSLWAENTWRHAPSRAEAIELLKQRTSTSGATTYHDAVYRPDLEMLEFRSKDQYGFESASYIPNRDIEQVINGRRVVKVIGCSKAYDPDAPLGTAETCSLWIYLGPGLSLRFGVYQQELPLLPALHDWLLNELEISRKN